MQFESFSLRAIVGYEPYTMLYKYGKRTCDFFGRFYSYFSLVFNILGAFLIKQLFHSRLLDMR